MSRSIISHSGYIPRIRATVSSCDWPVHTCCALKVLILERAHTRDVTIKGLECLFCTALAIYCFFVFAGCDSGARFKADLTLSFIFVFSSHL